MLLPAIALRLAHLSSDKIRSLTRLMSFARAEKLRMKSCTNPEDPMAQITFCRLTRFRIDRDQRLLTRGADARPTDFGVNAARPDAAGRINVSKARYAAIDRLLPSRPGCAGLSSCSGWPHCGSAVFTRSGRGGRTALSGSDRISGKPFRSPGEQMSSHAEHGATSAACRFNHLSRRPSKSGAVPQVPTDRADGGTRLNPPDGPGRCAP
jgi:hypothetical protein